MRGRKEVVTGLVLWNMQIRAMGFFPEMPEAKSLHPCHRHLSRDPVFQMCHLSNRNVTGVMPVFENLVFAAVMLSFQMNYEFKTIFKFLQ